MTEGNISRRFDTGEVHVHPRERRPAGRPVALRAKKERSASSSPITHDVDHGYGQRWISRASERRLGPLHPLPVIAARAGGGRRSAARSRDHSAGDGLSPDPVHGLQAPARAAAGRAVRHAPGRAGGGCLLGQRRGRAHAQGGRAAGDGQRPPRLRGHASPRRSWPTTARRSPPEDVELICSANRDGRDFIARTFAGLYFPRRRPRVPRRRLVARRRHGPAPGARWRSARSASPPPGSSRAACSRSRRRATTTAAASCGCRCRRSSARR